MLLTQRPFVSSIMGRRGGHAHKRPRTLARDFKTPRADVWEPGSGSERPGIAAQAQGVGQVNWSLTTDEMNNESFEAYYKARGEGGNTLCCCGIRPRRLPLLSFTGTRP